MAPQGFLKGLRALCDETGLLLLVDEVQTGMGRTGKLFGFQHEGIMPDAHQRSRRRSATGCPLAPCSAPRTAARALTPGTHGSTFGGNLLAAAAANVVASLMQRARDARATSSAKGEHFLAGARALQARCPTSDQGRARPGAC